MTADREGIMALVLKGFRDFISRGNVVDLAVAVVIGTAFTAVVTALVEDLLTPVVAAIFGEPDFSGLAFTINDSRFAYGDFLNALIAFVSIAAAIYFFVVVPLEAVKERSREPGEPGIKECPECLSEIPLGARRCAYCTSPQPS